MVRTNHGHSQARSVCILTIQLQSSLTLPGRGVAGAAYQIEGAAKAEGRGPSVWDRLSRVPNYVVNNETGDITDNHYYLYKQDIARLAAIGVNTYSLTLSWSRILPFGRGAVNQLAIDHYNDVINTCLQYNITPVVTLYHWDTPREFCST